MKTKAEVLEAINTIRRMRGTFHSHRQHNAVAICDGQIRALHWILGYKRVFNWYWCSGCQKTHRGLKCPKCGNERLLETGGEG